ncbi:hypothetical protein JCM19233_5614 [Vibrio astriarenae]|nr:hypothetical protein JCM19233_5614 [Vibrio sp. C7]
MKKLGSGVWYLFNGKQDNFKNWTIPNDKGERVVELKQEPIYKLADPNGVVHTFGNQKEFARANGLSANQVSAVLTGIRNHHQGWKKPG